MATQLPQTTKTIARLRDLVQRDVQAGWHISSEAVALQVTETGVSHGPLNAEYLYPAELNENGYIVWAAGRQVRWLRQTWTVPTAWNDFPVQHWVLRLVLAWWATDAQIFLQGERVQAGDLFDSMARVVLTPAAQPGEEITVTIRLESPGHDIGALMRSRLFFESAEGIDPGFVADELGVLERYATQFHPEWAAVLENAVLELDWSKLRDRAAFLTSLQQLRDRLLPLSAAMKSRRFHILGHAHLDMAWLWELPETYDMAERTFRSVLNLQQEFPVLTFCHTSPALYAWVEAERPQLFQAIQQAVQQGQWDAVGGMWIEPEVNLVCGESIARQLLYGQRYTEAKFGARSRVAWLTDSFGFCWQLPQLLRQAGIEYFVTQKLHWNDSTAFPHGFFRWRSPDGTAIHTLMSPPNIAGVMDTNPNPMADYAVKWEAQTGLREMFWLPGVGDHGGGPSRDMLAVQKRWAESPFFPQSGFTTAAQYLDLLRETADELPTWDDELYLEFHRGCYTSHADQKWFNRRCEIALFQAELWSAIARILNSPVGWVEERNPTPAPLYPTDNYDRHLIEQAWKKVLFNQFHDILPGTSIPEVFVTANQDWQWALTTAETLREAALGAIASCIQLPDLPSPNAQAYAVFNAINGQRVDCLEIDWPHAGAIAMLTDGEKLPSQKTAEGKLLVQIPLPAIGYTVIFLKPNEDESAPNFPAEFVLENEFLRVNIDSATGAIAQLFDRVNQREVLRAPGNVLQFFRDQGQYWDAWNIDPNYAEHPLPAAQLINLQWRECGPVRQVIQATWQFQASTVTQNYLLERQNPTLKMATIVDWQETHVLVKTAFPVNFSTDRVTCEMPCGAIARPTKPQTAAEKAKWEIPALQWADLSDSAYGISLLNDCKYGYDAQPDQLRLTLLRSPRWPDPGCDVGRHELTYALYPHAGTWQQARTVHHATRLNQPLLAVPVAKNPKTPENGLVIAPTGQFFDLGTDNVMLMAFKPSEDDPSTYLLRVYEAYGATVTLHGSTALNLTLDGQTNLLEDAISPQDTLNPWQIATYRWQS